MNTLKILHLADLHLNAKTHGRYDPIRRIHSRSLDFFRSFDFLVQTALMEQVSAVVIAGDLFDTWNLDPVYIELFSNSIAPLLNNGIPIICIPGNHDMPTTATGTGLLTALSEFPFTLLHVFSKPDLYRVETREGILQILAFPWPRAGVNKWQCLEQINHLILETDRSPAHPLVFVGHLTIEGASYEGTEYSTWAGAQKDIIIPTTPFEDVGIDYVALGHLHEFQDLQTERANAPIVYPGTIERITFSDRNSEKGGVIVHLTVLHQAEYTRVITPAREFVQLEYYLPDDIHDPVVLMPDLPEKTDVLEGAIVKIKVTAESMPHYWSMRPKITQLLKTYGVQTIAPIEVMQEEQRREVSQEIPLRFGVAEQVHEYVHTNPNLVSHSERINQLTSELLERVHT